MRVLLNVLRLLNCQCISSGFLNLQRIHLLLALKQNSEECGKDEDKDGGGREERGIDDMETGSGSSDEGVVEEMQSKIEKGLLKGTLYSLMQ